jgi:hypothetical protein
MESTYSEQLKELMGLVIEGKPKPQMVAKARELKVQLTKYWEELQRSMNLLDSMVSQYAPDEQWTTGFDKPLPTKIIYAHGIQSQESFGRATVNLLASPAQIIEIARKLVNKDGLLNTDEVIVQLKAQGDLRASSDIGKTVGNVLHRDGWIRLNTGLYELPEEKKKKEENIDSLEL